MAERIPPRKGDDDCINCYGMLYLHSEMKKSGQQPVCFGVKSIEEVKIPNERMKQLEKIPNMKSGTRIYSFGHTQCSGRMWRLLKPPVSQFGFQFQIRSIEEGAEKEEMSDRQKQFHDAHKDLPKMPGVQVRPEAKESLQPPGDARPLAVPVNNVGDIVDIVQKVPHNMLAFSQRHWQATKSVVGILTEDQPMRTGRGMYRLANTTYFNLQRMGGYVQRKVSSWVSKYNGGSKQQ